MQIFKLVLRNTVAKIGLGDTAGNSQDVYMEVERESRRVRATFKSVIFLPI